MTPHTSPPDVSTLTDRDRELIAGYTTAVRVAVEHLASVVARPAFGTGSSPYALTTQLKTWWEDLSRLTRLLSPAGRPYLEEELARWFRSRDGVLWACVAELERQALIGEPGVPRPEDPSTGRVGELGYYGYTAGEPFRWDDPVRVHLEVDSGGVVRVLPS
ncbi:MAG: hypothetical protein ACRDSP_05640 [Pseudonocardiaceae bacterium]